MPTTYMLRTHRGLESIASEEVRQLGGVVQKEQPGTVLFEAEEEALYRIALEIRTAQRLYLPLHSFRWKREDDLYHEAQKVDWGLHLKAGGTLRCEAYLHESPMQNSHFAALRLKDAIVDQFSEDQGKRPDVDRDDPDILVVLQGRHSEADILLDLGGGALRSFPQWQGQLRKGQSWQHAATMVRHADWGTTCSTGGTGLFVVGESWPIAAEALQQGLALAPGLLRGQVGVPRWLGCNAKRWKSLWDEAQSRHKEATEAWENPIYVYMSLNPPRRGFRDFLKEMGWSSYLHPHFLPKNTLEKELQTHSDALVPGWFCTEMPSFEELFLAEAVYTYARLGQQLRAHLPGWQASIYTAQPDLGHRLGLRANKRRRYAWQEEEYTGLEIQIPPHESEDTPEETPEFVWQRSEGAQMFANRLRKNLQGLRGWKKQQDITCYRAYDADMNEYNVAIDVYEDHAIIQEYQAPSTVDVRRAEQRLHDALLVAPDILEIPRHQVLFKQRKKQRGQNQYEKLNEEQDFFEVQEHGLRLFVNLTDYLDTGLFLDHRTVRRWIMKEAEGKDFLNLFCYTGSATVHAAAGGARTTCSVDMSKTYLFWARENMKLNGYSSQKHRYIQADCLQWLEHAQGAFDLIFLDPPTFSNSKRMEQTLDIQRDHTELIRHCLRLLRPDGTLIFSTNKLDFQIDQPTIQALGATWEDVSKASIPRDFQKSPKIHKCWRIRMGADKKKSDR
ncbi:MAG: bifunctional 23S rRNA (guanine(2069)-N(7))-methyltransferase RlmK/23S rRNA (guanine(2445)-N(2))-methyltransferase RlmL [Myxococcales bacterium]|nr:bifunctional 23S rRNA (guanine(2069)-N(7))-methyltransferase RlmK/23S rRNA (guanine(2445)-N(2))-methyltransferase RlmL [Myxococcales bacterium]